MMNLKYSFLIVTVFLFLQSFHIQGQTITKTGFYTVDSTYDVSTYQNAEAIAILNRYKPEIDAMTSLVIGESAQEMTAEMPESLLTNLFCDILLETGKNLAHEPVDLSLLNIGGFRAPLPKGEVTVGNIFKISPFENFVQVLYIKGKYINELLDFFAEKSMQPMGNVQLEVHNHKITKALIGGKPINPERTYKLVTINYLTQGGNGMVILKNFEKIVNSDLTLRDVIIGYFLEKQRKGEKVSSKLDQRVVEK